MSRNRLYDYQFRALIVMLILSDVFSIGVMWNSFGNGVWASYFIAAPFGTAVCLLWAKLIKGRGGLYAAFGGGRAAGLFFSLLYALYFTGFAALMLGEYAAFVSDGSLMETSPAVFTVPLAAVAAYGAKKGIRTLGRAAVIFGAAALVFMAAATLWSIAAGETYSLYPLLGSDTTGTARTGAAVLMLRYGELAPLMTLFDHSEGRGAGGAAGCALFTGLLLAFFTMGGVMASGRLSYIDGGTFFRGSGDVSSVLRFMTFVSTATFLFGAVFRVAVNLRASAEAIGRATGIKRERRLIYPLAAAAVILSTVIPSSSYELDRFFTGAYIPIAAVATVVLPLFAYIIWKVREFAEKKRHITD